MRSMPRWFCFPTLLLIAACDSGSSPTAPRSPAAERLASSWAGTRQIVEITDGADTCFGELLMASPTAAVEVELPPPSPSALGSVTLAELGDDCVTFVGQENNAVRWNVYKCTQHCWWASFGCGQKQQWSYCRGYDEFHGEIRGTTMSGEQTESFSVTDGKTSYVVRARLAYDLQRR